MESPEVKIITGMADMTVEAELRDGTWIVYVRIPAAGSRHRIGDRWSPVALAWLHWLMVGAGEEWSPALAGLTEMAYAAVEPMLDGVPLHLRPVL